MQLAIIHFIQQVYYEDKKASNFGLFSSTQEDSPAKPETEGSKQFFTYLNSVDAVRTREFFYESLNLERRLAGNNTDVLRRELRVLSGVDSQTVNPPPAVNRDNESDDESKGSSLNPHVLNSLTADSDEPKPEPKPRP